MRAAPDAPSRQSAEHEARKAAKRVRYAAEAAVPVAGEPARQLARAAEEVQEALGRRQDAVVAQAVLADLALAPGTPAGYAFAYGLVAGGGHEQAADEGASAQLQRLRRTADRWPGR